nr:MAG: hypothetical protein [Apis mellifera filamentous virus]
MVVGVQCAPCRVCRVTGVKIAFLLVCWSLHVERVQRTIIVGGPTCRMRIGSIESVLSSVQSLRLLQHFVLYCITLYYIVLHCIILYYIVLYCIILYYIVLYCIIISFHVVLFMDCIYCMVVFIVWLYLLYVLDLLCVLCLLYGVHVVREPVDSSFGWFASGVNLVLISVIKFLPNNC